jgi:hypothetical protein
MSGDNRNNVPRPHGQRTETADDLSALAAQVVRRHAEAQRRAADCDNAVTLVFSRREAAPPRPSLERPEADALSNNGGATHLAAREGQYQTSRGALNRMACVSVVGLLACVSLVTLALQGTAPAIATSAHLSGGTFAAPPIVSAANIDGGKIIVPDALRAPTDDLGQSIYAKHLTNAPANERACLAKALYYEARGETYEGQVAVAQVIVNRTRFKGWPDTICGVVHQGADRGEKCQFSFVCRNSLTEPSGDAWDQAKTIAEAVASGRAWLREAVDATHYHTTTVAPIWRLGLTPIRTIGAHIFYQESDGHLRETKAYGAAHSDRQVIAASSAIKSIEPFKANTVASKSALSAKPKAAANGPEPDSKNVDWSSIMSQR